MICQHQNPIKPKRFKDEYRKENGWCSFYREPRLAKWKWRCRCFRRNSKFLFIKHHKVKNTLFCYEISKLNNNKMDATHSVSISGHQITFQFQLGLVRDRVTVDSNELNLNSLKVSNSNIYISVYQFRVWLIFQLYLNYNSMYLTLKTF